jgi:histidyl-tRNA synthetase
MKGATRRTIFMEKVPTEKHTINASFLTDSQDFFKCIERVIGSKNVLLRVTQVIISSDQYRKCIAIAGEGVGSIAGGGRYDNLVGMFSKSGQQIPCVGGSVRVERVFSILEAKAIKSEDLRESPTLVYLAAAGADLTAERIKLCNGLWASGIPAEFSYKAKVKALDQFGYCERMGIPLCVVLGPEELAAGQCKLRVVADRSEVTVPLDEITQKIREKLALLGLAKKLAEL